MGSWRPLLANFGGVMDEVTKEVAAAPPPDPSTSAPGVLHRYWFNIPLWKRILPALVLGIVVGLLLGEDAVQVRWIGDIFVRLTRMLVAPLVFFTIVSGVIALGDPRKLGSLGARTIGLFIFTGATAATLGLAIALLLTPGAGVEVSGAVPSTIRSSTSLSEQLLGIIPINPVMAMAEGNMLAIIFFSMVFAVGVISLGPRGQPLADLLELAAAVMMQLIRFVIEVAPFGVFGLTAAAVGVNGLGVFVSISYLAAGVAGGCLILTLVVQPLLVRFLAGLSPLAFLRGTVDAMLVAFSTSSSSASLPVELSVAQNNLGIGKPIRSAVLPIGVSIARDGTAMYVAMLSVFAVQALGLTLQPFDLVLVVAVSTLIALSSPPVPSAALFMMAAVLSVVGIDDGKSAIIVGFILPFDRILDMMRTIPNVMSNLTNATIVARWTGELDEEVFNRRSME